MTKFTKGEWEVSTCGSRVSVWSDNESIIEPMTFRYPMPEDEERVMANAHLIAAAPDMYALLEDILEMDSCGLKLWHENSNDITILLKKARGE